MTAKRTLQLILGISLFGVAFSGRLSYLELTGETALMCPSPGAAGTIFGYPACVYGLLMYTIIAGLAAWGLLSLRGAALKPQHTTDHSRPLSGGLPS
jgi:hypothetical protein